jgi:nucleolin
LDGRQIRVEFSGQQANSFGGNSGPAGESNTLFVGNLGFRTEENSIRNFFSECGTVTRVRIALNEEGRAKGFAHVEFASPSEAQEAMKLNGADLDGRAVRLDISVPRQGGDRGGRGNFRGGDRGSFRGGDRGSFRGGDRGNFRGRGGPRGGRGRNPMGAAANRGSIVAFEGKRQML